MNLALRSVAASALAMLVAAAPVRAYDWLQFNGNAAHSGNNTAEAVLNRGNVAALAQKWQVALPSTADGAPVFLEGVTTPAGVRDLLLVTTRTGWLVAINAATGATVWSKQYGPGACSINNPSNAIVPPPNPCYTTSSPALDPNRQFVYTYGLDGFVHKHQVGDGLEIVTGGWPQRATYKGYNEKGSSALAIATAGGVGYLYVVNGGYPGDAGDYQGHVTAINLATGAQNVFNTMCSQQAVHLVLNDPLCSAKQSAVWARPAVIHDAGTNRIFIATGNGSYNGNTGGRNWSESILALNPDGTGAGGNPVDAYTPTNFQSLDNADADLGSTAPVILPVPPASSVQHLAVQGGKDANLRLVNLANLSGQGGPGHTGGEIGPLVPIPQGGGLLAQPAAWVNPVDGATWVFVVNGNGASGLRLAIAGDGTPSLVPQWNIAQGGQSAIVANDVLYFSGGGRVRAYNPLTGAALWSAPIGGLKWQSPIVANGVVYATDNTNLTAFAVPGTAPAFTSAAATTFTVGTAGTFTLAASGTPAPVVGESGAPPSGIAFTPATRVLAGTPAAGTGGVHALTFVANNGVVPNATQSFTLTINEAPAFISAAATTFTAGAPGAFTFATSGYPAAAVGVTGALPAGVAYTAGTRTLSGTPAAGTGGVWPLTLAANNGVPPNAGQAFTLTIHEAPAITSANAIAVPAGLPASFTVTRTGYPAATIARSGALPPGMTFDPATGLLSGTPAVGAEGGYPLVFTATNGVAPNAVQNFTLTINPAPLSNRTFVAPSGSDATACTLTAPCRSFTAAHARTNPDGAIVVLDSGGYGPVTITKPLTIAAPAGVHAGISVPTGTGIIVAPGAGRVTLRGLTLGGTGGAVGIDFQSGDALYLDRVQASGFTTAGLLVQRAVGGAVFVHDSTLRDNAIGATMAMNAGVGGTLEVSIGRSRFEGNATQGIALGDGTAGVLRDVLVTGSGIGVRVQPSTAGATAKVEFRGGIVTKNLVSGLLVGGVAGTAVVLHVVGAEVSANGTGTDVKAGGAAYVSGTTISGNVTGVSVVGGGVAVSGGDNRLYGNLTDGTFTSTAPNQ